MGLWDTTASNAFHSAGLLFLLGHFSMLTDGVPRCIATDCLVDMGLHELGDECQSTMYYWRMPDGKFVSIKTLGEWVRCPLVQEASVSPDALSLAILAGGLPPDSK